MGTKGIRAIMCGTAAVALLAACGGGDGDHARTDAAGAVVRIDTPPAGQLPRGVAPTAYRLNLETDPAAPAFSGTVEIDLALEAPHARVWLHALGPDVTSAKAILPDGREIAATFEAGLAGGGVSKVDFAEAVPAGAATLVLDYIAPYNLALAGLYKSEAGGVPYLSTQMEPIDARRAFPSFDEPRFKTPWTLTVTAPEGNKVVTNAPLVARTDLGDGQVRHEFATTRKIQSYLVALAVGPYDEVESRPIPANSVRNSEVVLRGFAAAGKGKKLGEALEATYEILDIQEKYFDYPYPYAKLDLLAVPDFAYGAMENAGAIIYREAALLIDESTSLNQKRGILTTHAHELAHQWFGNLVTPKWWDDIWLNEAFATWMSYKTMHAYDPTGGFDRLPIRRGLGAMGVDALTTARQIRNPITRNGDILDAFDGITYSKGGSVLNMFETFLGEEAFREGMRLHMRRFEDAAADVNDFMSSLAEGSGNGDVVDSFSTFIFQPGTPFLDVQLSCTGGVGSLSVTQSRYAPLGSSVDTNALWKVPFAARLSDGRDVRALLSDKTTQISLDGGCADWAMPNADGTGYWRFTTDTKNWETLTDNFSALGAGEQLVFSDSLAAAFRAGEVSASDMLAGLKATTTGQWDAVSQALGAVGRVLNIMDEADQPLMRQWTGETYRPVYDALVARDDLSQGETLLRQQLYTLLVNTAEDAALRRDLLSRAESYVGVTGTPRPDALAPAEIGAAMTVGTQEGGNDFFNAALDLALASRNQTVRGTVLGALGGNTTDTGDATRLFNTALGDQLTGRDMFGVIGALMANDAARDTVWPMVQTNFEAIIARLPEIRKPAIARLAGSFCDARETDAAAAFFTSKADLITGYERSLAQATEGAKLCAALKAAKANELAEALKR